jgi:chemotaxis protein MotB
MAADHYGEDLEYERKRRRRSKLGCAGWILLVLALAAAALLIKFVYLPLKAERARLDGAVAEAGRREAALKRRASEAEARVLELKTREEQLTGKLSQSEAEREKLEAELKRVQSELSKLLEPEITAGNVRIKRRGNELVVELSDQILFDSGRAEVNESGQKVLAQVARSLATLNGYAIQVGGHTDNARVVNPETQEKFPTNWELSTARATQVVRFLEERGKVPGSRLVAAGFSQFRPTASNTKAEDRQKNRRIEIVLLQYTPAATN